ncbi:MAG: toll/interleukin-1 receptor domain-containing protein [Planctomycetota bacterium]
MSDNIEPGDLQVFLSSSPEGRELVPAVARKLKASGYRVFDPSESIEIGGDWYDKTREALEKSNAMVALLTPNSSGSRHLNREIEHALFDQRYEGRLLPVLVRDTGQDLRDVPSVLRRIQLLQLDPKQSPELMAEEVTSKFRELIQTGRAIP